tara:strand:+ start:26323 stop:27213 length:891 start_codon:yes stop_codon:yes gene_type:complete
MDDVVIVGGSFAGLAAALQLGRARRRVTVLDTGLPRNRFAGHSHGLLGHDHRPPLEILGLARQQLARYPTVKLVDARAESASGALDSFVVSASGGLSLPARRLLLSYGVTDLMPAIPGFAECWGTSIVPCPYCDGFEVADQHWGLIYSGPHALHMVMLYGDWTSKLTLFADGHQIDAQARAELARRNVKLVEGRISVIQHQQGRIATVGLDTGAEVPVDVLFAHPRNRPSVDLHSQLGLALEEGPFGPTLAVDERRQTSLAGVYAAGDLANPMASVTLASGHGAMAGIFAQQSMLV